jgi:hypothetical protein
MKKFLKTIIIAIIIILLLAQFLPKYNYNNGDALIPASIETSHKVPEDVAAILKTSCYDCHSNHTSYPWYANIQPVSKWLGNHVNEGKGELNFSEFGIYSLRRQYHKLEEISEQVEENEMPLSSYTLIHGDASLNEAQKKTLSSWVKSLRDSFKLVYPADSLQRKRS